MPAILRSGAITGLLCVLVPFARGADLPEAKDPRLQLAYQKLRFARLLPTEAVDFIQQQLQGVEDAIPALSELIKDQRPEVRTLSALLLGEIGDSKAALPLWSLMTDSSPVVRLTSGGALLRLAEMTEVVLTTDGLNDERPEVRRWALLIFAKLNGREAESALVTALRDSDRLVRREAARCLASCGSENAVAPLIDALDDPSELVREAAAFSLGKFQDSAVTPALLKGLRDKDWHVRAASAFSLKGSLAETPAVTRPLAEHLSTDSFELVRDRSAQGLLLPNDELAIDALVKAIVGEDDDARFHAAETIIRSKAVLSLPRLAAKAKDPRPQVREKVLEVLGELGGSEYVPVVGEALADPEVVVRYAAVRALHKMQNQETGSALENILKDPSPHVRAEAARALGDLGDRETVPQLIELLRDDNGFVRSAAAEALGQLGDRSAVPSLIEILAGKKIEAVPADGGLVIGTQTGLLPDVARLKALEEKIKAVQALGSLRAPEAVDPIIEHGLKAGDAGLRAESAAALGRIGEERAVGPLEEVVSQYYKETPPALDEGPVITGAVPESIRIMKEREARVRASVAWALGEIGGEESLPILQRAEQDENSLVRDAASEAIAKVNDRLEAIKLAASQLPPPVPEEEGQTPEPESPENEAAPAAEPAPQP